MATPLFHHPLPPAPLLHIETSLETLNKLLGEGGIGAAFVFLFRFPSTGGRIEENRGEEMAFFVSFCNYSNYDLRRSLERIEMLWRFEKEISRSR